MNGRQAKTLESTRSRFGPVLRPLRASRLVPTPEIVPPPEPTDQPPSSARPEPMEQKRVLVVAPQPFYEDRGTPIAVRQVIQALIHLGHPVDLVTYPLGETQEIPGLRYFRGSNPLRFRHVPIGFSLRKLVLDTALLPPLARRLRHPYHHIHAVEEAVFLAVLLSGRRNVPILYDMQCSLAEQMGRQWWAMNTPSRRLFAAAQEWVFRRVDLVVASAGLAERVSGVDVREWRFASPAGEVPSQAITAARERLGVPENGKVVLYSGSFAEYQGLPDLVAAMPRVLEAQPAVTFVLIGTSNGDGEAIRRQVRGLGLAERVRLLPRQSRESLAAYLDLADVLVSPRRYGGNLPLKIFDFLAAGRAIVATDIPAHRAVLDDRLARLVAPHPLALANALTTLLQDDEARHGLAERARTYATERLGWVAFMNTVEEITRLMARGRRVPRA